MKKLLFSLFLVSFFSSVLFAEGPLSGEVNINNPGLSGGGIGAGEGLFSQGNNSTTTPSPSPAPVPTSQPAPVCSAQHIDSYIRLGARNNPQDVKKLQLFLNTFEREKLVIDGIYKKSDFEAVKRFQFKYREILNFWHIQKPTGYVYKKTVEVINRLWADSCKTAS